MIKYIELKIERAELENQVIPVTEPPPQVTKDACTREPGKPSLGMLPKAKAAPWYLPEVDEMSVWDQDVISQTSMPTGHAERATVMDGKSHATDGGRDQCHHAPPGDDVGQPRPSERCRRSRTVSIEQSEMLGFITAGETCNDCPQFDHLSKHSCRERQRFQNLVCQYTKELQSVMVEPCRILRSRGQLKLLEVFCGPNSQLTHQVQQLGFRADRMGLAQCDLQQAEGRRLLFQTVVARSPEHLWFSPSCGPWSGWSTLNGSRSLEAWDSLQESRLKHVEQIALGVVLLRHQCSVGHHMHWEQSQASLMFKLPYLQEVHQRTLAVDFDMCTAGNLKDPENGKAIKKGMTVLSTSTRVSQSLHNKRCLGNHDHQVIEGSTVFQQQRMNRSTFSEAYPRKFARDMAKVLCKLSFPHERPVAMSMFAGDAPALVNEPAMKRRRLFVQAKPQLSRSSEMTADTPLKRRKLDGKQPCENALEAWTKVFDMVDPLLNRVRKRVIRDSQIIQELQRLMPDKTIQFAIGCRGSSRTIAPSEDTAHLEVPFRKCAFLKRGTTRIFVEDQWENWSELSKRQRVRPSHACRINITVLLAIP